MNGMHENFPYIAPDIQVTDNPPTNGGTESHVPEAALVVNLATNVTIPPEFAKRGHEGITEYLRIILCDTSLRHPALRFNAVIHPATTA